MATVCYSVPAAFCNGGAISELWADTYRYNYFVINLKGEVAVFCGADQKAGSAPSLPDIIKTPLLKDNAYHYYLMDDFDWDSTQGTLYWKWYDGSTWYETSGPDYFDNKAPYGLFTIKEDATELTTLPATDNTNIIVIYDINSDGKYTTTDGQTIDLSGKTYYNISLKNSFYNSTFYLHYATNSRLATTVSDESSLIGNSYLWNFTGNDPYNILIKNKSKGSSYVIAGTEKTDDSYSGQMNYLSLTSSSSIDKPKSVIRTHA